MTPEEKQYKITLRNLRTKAEKISNEKNTYQEAATSFQRVLKENKFKAPAEAFRLAIKMREAAENHEKAPWVIAIVVAMSCDPLDIVPVAGWIISWCFRPYLFFFLWGRGTWRIRLIYYGLLLLDYIPVINILPISTACVLYAYYRSKKEIRIAEKKLELLPAK